MKFSEKLQFLRKEHKLSQEQLADMLDVSRQAVSKWESGQTYPEMDKLIELSKIFKCSLDDLTNDEIKNINSSKSKNYINTIIDEIMDTINKSVDIFKNLDFKHICKFILLFLFILIVLSLILKLPFNYLSDIGLNLFNKFGDFGNILYGLWKFILDLSYFIIILFIMIYLYKEKFLEKYSIIEEKHIKKSDIIEEKEKVNNYKTSKENKEEIVKVENKVKKNHNYAIFDFLASIIIFFIKFIAFFVGLLFVMVQFFLFSVLAISIYLIVNNIISFGLLFGLAFSIILCSLLIEIIYNFIVSRKNNFKKVFILFLISIFGLGISSGILIVEISKYSFINKAPDKEHATNTKEINFNKDMIINFNDYNISYEFIADDNLKKKVLIEYSYYDEFTDVTIYNQDNNVYLNKSDEQYLNKDNFKSMLKDFSNKKIYNYSYLYRVDIKIYSSKENIKIINDNLKEYYNNKESYNYEIEEYQNQIYYLEQKVDELEEKNEILEEKIEEYQYKIDELLDI